MGREILQVRDVPTEDAQALRKHAAARNMSLSSYLRELIRDDAARPTMSEVLARIASRDSIEASRSDIQSFIDVGR